MKKNKEELKKLLITVEDNGHKEEIKLFSEEQSREEKLIIACQLGRSNIVKSLIEEKVNVNYDSGVSTPLTNACQFDKIEIAELLLANNANPNLTPSKFPNSPLMYATSYHNLEIIKLLMGYKADVDMKKLMEVAYPNSRYKASITNINPEHYQKQILDILSNHTGDNKVKFSGATDHNGENGEGD